MTTLPLPAALLSALLLLAGAGCDADTAAAPCPPDACAPHERCLAAPAGDRCEAVCPVPDAPTPAHLDTAAVLRFTLPAAQSTAASAIEVAAGPADAPPAWAPGDTVDVGALAATDGPLTVLARAIDRPAGCDDAHFAFTYDVRAAGFPPAAETPGSDAVPADAPHILAWATEVADVTWGADVDAPFRRPDNALGPVTGDPLATLTLGNGGAATLRFSPALTDGPGPDLAIFENGVTDGFLELARVEVSSDGLAWARFDAVYTGAAPVAAYAALDPTRVDGLAGKHRVGFGTPFDLANLRHKLAVRTGRVDLSRVAWIRVVDVIGDGREHDAFGRPIYDPFPTIGSGGFDLDGVAALNVAPD